MKESPEDLACLYVLDQLDPADRAAFEARLAREPELAALVRQLETGLARGVQALPPLPPPATLLHRIETRIDAQSDRAARRERAESDATVFSFPSRWLAAARWGIAAVIAVSLATLAVQSLRRPGMPPVIVVGLDPDENTFAELRLQGSPQDSDARFMRLASLAQDFWEKPASVALKGEAPPRTCRGYALFDPGSHQGFIAIKQLPALTENQRYHLWVADTMTSRVRDAGILPLAGLNRGLYSFTIEPAENAQSDRLRFFVTIEEHGDAAAPPRPRGKVVLGNQPL